MQGAASPKFAVLHLILDEQAGIHGIYPDAEGLRLRQDLRNFFEARGFTLYGRAYSEHVHTVNAIPAALNFGTRFAANGSGKGVTVGRTRYFEKLAGEGFKLHVLQNDFAELCADNPITVCTTYDSSSLRPTLEAPLSTLQRAQMIALKFLALSSVGNGIGKRYNGLGSIFRPDGDVPKYAPDIASRSSAVATMSAIHAWLPEVREARAGDVYFAHLLLPHFPHVLRPDCSYKPWDKWVLKSSRKELEKLRATYAEQDRCAMRQVGQLIRAFEQSPGGKAGVIIIHGDHGYRLMRKPPVTDLVGQFTDEDVIAGHATLFAIRGPQTRPRYDETPQAITALLRDFSASGFHRDPEPETATVLHLHFVRPALEAAAQGRDAAKLVSRVPPRNAKG